MMHFGLGLILLVITSCVSSLETPQDLGPTADKIPLYSPPSNPPAPTTAKLIDGAMAIANPHLRSHLGHWLLANQSIQVVVTGVPSLPYKTAKQDIIIDSFIWSKDYEGWRRQIHIPPVALWIKPSNSDPIQPVEVRTLNSKGNAHLLVSYRDSKGTGGVVTYTLWNFSNIVSIQFDGFPETYGSPVLSVWNHLEPHNEGMDRLINVSNGKESLNILVPRPSPIKRTAIESQVSVETPLRTALLTFGNYGDLLIPYLIEKAPKCLSQKKPESLGPCLQDYSETYEGTLSSENFDLDIRISEESGAFLGRLFIEKGGRLTLPLLRKNLNIMSQKQIIANLNPNQTVNLSLPHAPKVSIENLTLETLLRDEFPYTYNYKDPHGLVFKALSNKPLVHFNRQWISFYTQNKGPRTFLFPKFVRYKYPGTKLELSCTDSPISQQELYLFLKLANLDQIDISTCNSLKSKELFTRLYFQLEASSARKISLIDNTFNLQRKFSSPKKISESIQFVGGTFDFSLAKNKGSIEFVGRFKAAPPFNNGALVLHITDRNGHIVHSQQILADKQNPDLEINNLENLPSEHGLRVELFRRLFERGLSRIGTTPIYKF